MPEKSVNFKTKDEIVIEGLISEGTTALGVVITHPHPLYGGDMRNIVVETLQKAFAQKGYTTLRFNFRGVGKSTGAHDDGNGEQSDVAGAMDFLRQKGLARIYLTGYSFGSWVIANMPEKTAADGIVLVSPPATMMAFDDKAVLPNLKLVVTGEFDEFAPPDLIKKLVTQWNPAAGFTVINGADHFFFGFTEKLLKILVQNE